MSGASGFIAKTKITPLRPRGAEPEPPKAPDAVIVTPPPPKAPDPVIVPPPPKPDPLMASPPPPADNNGKPRKEETFYDLESLEAEMARLLGRES